MRKLTMSVLSLCFIAVLLFSGCSAKSSQQATSDDTSEQTTNSSVDVQAEDEVLATSDTARVDKDDTSNEAANVPSSTPENDTDIGLKNIKIDSTEANLTEEQKTVIQYFDNDYIRYKDCR